MTMQGRVCFMNFDFLKSITIIHPFYQFCEDAEEFALSKPDFCGASARKAIEYIVRLMYAAAIQTEANQLTVCYSTTTCPLSVSRLIRASLLSCSFLPEILYTNQ